IRRRVALIADACRRIMNGDLAERLPVEASHDEFDELAVAVNQMLSRIQQQTEMLQTTFDSAAHDLRAPLYRARVRIEESLQHERSEEHTSELQSRENLVCRLLLEKKNV